MTERNPQMDYDDNEEEDNEEEEEEEKFRFSLFTASIGNLVPSYTNASASSTDQIKTARELRDDHAVRRLKKLQNDLVNVRCTQFFLRGPYNFAAQDVWYQTLTLSSIVASAIVEFFHHERKSKVRQWNSLQLWECVANLALFQVLEVGRRLQLFKSIEFKRMGNPPSDLCKLLAKICLDNPCLETFRLRDVRHFDSECAEVLRHMLETKNCLVESDSSTSGSAASTATQSNNSNLQKLGLYDIMLTSPLDIQPIAEGLRLNDTLVELTISRIQTMGTNGPTDLLKSLYNHPTLQRLALPCMTLQQSALLALRDLLSHPSCRISSLDISMCRGMTSSYVHSIRMDSVITIIQECQSLERIRLAKNRFSSRDMQALLQIVHNRCPNMTEIDLSHNQIERVLWPVEGSKTDNSALLTNQNAKEVTFSHTACSIMPKLEFLWLSQNPIMHNRFRARLPKDDERMVALLQSFPGLSHILGSSPPLADTSARSASIHVPFRFAPFSWNTVRRMAYNRTTMGRLEEGQLPLALWPTVFERARKVLSHPQNKTEVIVTENRKQGFVGLDYLLPRTTESRCKRQEDLIVCCKASMLFLLLKNHPDCLMAEKIEIKDKKGNRRWELEKDCGLEKDVGKFCSLTDYVGDGESKRRRLH